MTPQAHLTPTTAPPLTKTSLDDLPRTPRGRVLVVAGSDSGGGAGIQADIKSITVNGAYAATAVTAITVQNTCSVSSVIAIPPDCIAAQMRTVLEDIGADVIKIGMLGDATTVRIVAAEYHAACNYCDAPPILLCDPVMVAKSGDALLAANARAVLSETLLPYAHLITPNLPEAAALLGFTIDSPEVAEEAAHKLAHRYNAAILLKGGHLHSDDLIHDLLLANGHIDRFTAPRIHSKHTHGTGCTLASAIAAGLARGLALGRAVREARDYVRQTIEDAPQLGAGHGPLGHNGPLRLHARNPIAGEV